MLVSLKNIKNKPISLPNSKLFLSHHLSHSRHRIVNKKVDLRLNLCHTSILYILAKSLMRAKFQTLHYCSNLGSLSNMKIYMFSQLEP